MTTPVTAEMIERALALRPGTIVLSRPIGKPQPDDPYRIYAQVEPAENGQYRVTLMEAWLVQGCNA